MSSHWESYGKYISAVCAHIYIKADANPLVPRQLSFFENAQHNFPWTTVRFTNVKTLLSYSPWLGVFQWKTLHLDKTVIVEVGESQPRSPEPATIFYPDSKLHMWDGPIPAVKRLPCFNTHKKCLKEWMGHPYSFFYKFEVLFKNKSNGDWSQALTKIERN